MIVVEPSSLLQGRDYFLIHVKPKSRKTALKGYDAKGDFFLLDVKAVPENGKANAEIEKYFSKLLKKSVRIKSGHSSKKKLLVVS